MFYESNRVWLLEVKRPGGYRKRQYQVANNAQYAPSSFISSRSLGMLGP